MDPDDHVAMDHDRTTDEPESTMEADDAAMSHTARHHMEGRYGDDDDDAPEPPAAPDELRPALEAYLDIHDALASDQLEGVADHARRLANAVAALTEAPPAGDPHFWHVRSGEVQTARSALTALADAADLEGARAAFGRFSALFAGWVEVLGVPAGYDLSQFTCSMYEQAPEGGVWLQERGEAANPYFGSAMPMCGTSDGESHSREAPDLRHGDHH